MCVIWKHRKVYKFWQTVNGYFKDEALSIDVYGNRAMRTTWNAILIIPVGYQFGHPGETISSALGKNQLKGTLRPAGQFLVWLLNLIEKDHCIKAIKKG